MIDEIRPAEAGDVQTTSFLLAALGQSPLGRAVVVVILGIDLAHGVLALPLFLRLGRDAAPGQIGT